MANIAPELIGHQLFEGFYWVQYQYEGEPAGGWVPAEIDADGDIHGAGIDLDDAEVSVVAIGHEICQPFTTRAAHIDGPMDRPVVALMGRWELDKAS